MLVTAGEGCVFGSVAFNALFRQLSRSLSHEWAGVTMTFVFVRSVVAGAAAIASVGKFDELAHG